MDQVLHPGSSGDRHHDRGRTAAGPATPHLRRWVRSASWAVLWFVAGAIFWHFVGFWNFVTQVVLKGPEPPARREAAAITTGSIGPPERPALLKQGTSKVARCSELALDRSTGATRLHTCMAAPLAMRHVAGPGRSDLLATALAGGGRPGGSADIGFSAAEKPQ